MMILLFLPSKNTAMRVYVKQFSQIYEISGAEKKLRVVITCGILFVSGAFNFLGSSHQWWHLIIVVAFAYWHSAGRELLYYQMRHECHV